MTRCTTLDPRLRKSLARIGRLEAVKRGRLWYTTRKAVKEYRRSVAAGAHRRG